MKVVQFTGSHVAIAHGVFAYLAFFLALIIGYWLHYEKIVQNASFGYPDEWFPSVSATIGDRYPERSVFQLLIALTSGPRFLMIFLCFLIHSSSRWGYVALISGLVRTFTCGGWVYITSTDDHDWHDIFMISYILLTIPWELSMIILTKGWTKKARSHTCGLFFISLGPLVYFFIEHKVNVVAGAYSIYAYFEWGLIILDVAFDTWSIWDLAHVNITINGQGIEVINKSNNQETEVKINSKQNSNKSTVGELIGEKLIQNNDSRIGIIDETVICQTLDGEKSKFTKSITEKVVVDSIVTDDFTVFQVVVNTINSFIFWSVSTSLFLCLWYFPLWHMGISGYEATIACFFLAPLLCFILTPGLVRWPFIPRALVVLFGVGAYRIHDPEHKLLSITVATTFAILSFVLESWSYSNQPRKYQSYFVSLLTGLLASSVAKFYWYSNNPIWPVMNESNGGLNDLGVLLGLLASFFTPSFTNNLPKVIISKQGGSLVLATLGLGGFLFNIFTYLTDSSTMTFWVWEGFPIRGPTPISGALVHLGSFASGLVGSTVFSQRITGNLVYSLVFGGVSLAVFLLLSGWVGFAGASVYTFYLATIAPIIGQSIMGYDPRIAYFLGFLIFDLLASGGVWTVAYAFVPGGELLRERSELLTTISFICIFAGIFNYNLRNYDGKFTKLFSKPSHLSKHILTILTVLTAISVSVYFRRMPQLPTQPYNAGSQSFTAGIWCVHFGIDNDMWSSETRMRNLIHDAEVDIIGLLESDTQRLIGGNRDFTQKIAEDLGMYVDYGPGPNKNTWGAALLSKFPIINSTHHLLPSPVGELAPAIHATLDIYGELVDIVVFHSGQEEDVEDRRLQSLAVEEIMASSDRPMVLLSYLVTKPLEGNYFTYTSEKSGMHDIDSTDWDRWCEYILFKNLKKVAYARISRSTITDTELQIAKFKLLNDKEKESIDEEFLYGNNFVHENEIDENLRMPKLFRGDGVRGHFYHVFDEPRYFAQSK